MQINRQQNLGFGAIKFIDSKTVLNQMIKVAKNAGEPVAVAEYLKHAEPRPVLGNVIGTGKEDAALVRGYGQILRKFKKADKGEFIPVPEAIALVNAQEPIIKKLLNTLA